MVEVTSITIFLLKQTSNIFRNKDRTRNIKHVGKLIHALSNNHWNPCKRFQIFISPLQKFDAKSQKLVGLSTVKEGNYLAFVVYSF